MKCVLRDSVKDVTNSLTTRELLCKTVTQICFFWHLSLSCLTVSLFDRHMFKKDASLRLTSEIVPIRTFCTVSWTYHLSDTDKQIFCPLCFALILSPFLTNSSLTRIPLWDRKAKLVLFVLLFVDNQILSITFLPAYPGNRGRWQKGLRAVCVCSTVVGECFPQVTQT